MWHVIILDLFKNSKQGIYENYVRGWQILFLKFPNFYLENDEIQQKVERENTKGTYVIKKIIIHKIKERKFQKE